MSSFRKILVALLPALFILCTSLLAPNAHAASKVSSYTSTLHVHNTTAPKQKINSPSSLDEVPCTADNVIFYIQFLDGSFACFTGIGQRRLNNVVYIYNFSPTNSYFITTDSICFTLQPQSDEDFNPSADILDIL